MSKKRIKTKPRWQPAGLPSKIKFFLLGAVLGLSVGGLSVVIISLMNKSQKVQDTTNYHPATYAVAEKFLCGCPDCAEDLVICSCSSGSGGNYELYYISEQLKAGLSEKEVIDDVYRKFGNIKPRYEYLIEKTISPKN